jgi:hypothetical protein
VDDVVVADGEPSVTHDVFFVFLKRDVCHVVGEMDSCGYITLLEGEVLWVHGYLSFFLGFSFKPCVSFFGSRNHAAGMSFAA